MAFFTDTTTTTAGNGLFARIARVFARIQQSLAESREFRRTYNELNSLSDRELADLGLNRMDLSRVARDTVYGN
ncbi:DUF1127 domain-containing protein [Oceanibium sediminis]|uniref:DUF1127 domain-containing protein n=1 Tax=Oceanibium sediminis TaxID=2026339 RepID=UPI000DD31972|nr:DUF1127 domain-containing protein [Oceanibium sediminis]